MQHESNLCILNVQQLNKMCSFLVQEDAHNVHYSISVLTHILNYDKVQLRGRAHLSIANNLWNLVAGRNHVWELLGGHL